MRFSMRLAAAVCGLLLLLPLCAAAQFGPPTIAGPMQTMPPSSVASITINVYDENGIPLTRQALVRLEGITSGVNVWGTTGTQSKVEFDGVAGGDYEYEVSAAGYKTAKKDIHIFDVAENYQENVTLVSEAGAAPPPLTPGQILAPKPRKEAEKGISALKSGDYGDAQKHFEKALKLAPGNADVNFLMGYLWLQKKDLKQAEAYFTKATTLDPKNARALTALGQLRIQQKDYAAAIAPLEQAVGADPKSWQAHWVLADAELRLDHFDKACEEAQKAVETGTRGKQNSAKSAELILGEALGNLGRYTEAISALESFLKDFPHDPAANDVYRMIAELDKYRREDAASAAGRPVLVPAAATTSPMASAVRSRMMTVRWSPADVDDEKPVVAEGSACPASRVIDGASKRAAELVDNISKYGATEHMLHEDLDEFGGPMTHQQREYSYVAEIDEPKPGTLLINEYRQGLTDAGGFPDHIATIGVPILAMIFHPDLRSDFDMTCEGLGDWHGQATWLVHFRQKANRPSRVQTYVFSDGSYPVALKGRAWIAAGSLEIVHIETDLVEPMPKIQLLTEHQSVDYAPVEFKQKKIQLWLPKQADLYFEFRRHRYYRRHSYDHFILFSVGSRQKIQHPKTPETTQAKPSNQDASKTGASLN